jgi:ADP-ribose pyrophosphatase YjhB (NUDIX family)
MGTKSDRLRPEPDREPRTQYAALPWRKRDDGATEILLITSRESRRWVIPKGWPMRDIKPGSCAAQEAFEEAGVLGMPGARASASTTTTSGAVRAAAARARAGLSAGGARGGDTWPEMASATGCGRGEAAAWTPGCSLAGRAEADRRCPGRRSSTC